MIGQRQPKLPVQAGLGGGVGRGKFAGHVADDGEALVDFLAGQARALRSGTQSRYRYRAPGLGLGYPAGHDRGVRTRFERGAVLAELRVAVGDLAAGLRGDRVVQVAVLGLFEVADRARQFAGSEQAAKPVVDAGHNQALAQVHRARVTDLILGGVLGQEHAPVVGGVVVPASLHPPVADPAVQQPAQQVRTRSPARCALGVGDPGAAQRLGPFEGGGVDQRLVHGLLGPDPVTGLVPALLGGEPECDVVHVEKHLVLALAVPDLAAGVPRVAEDRGDRAPRPGDPAPVPVAGRVVGRW